MFDGHYDLWRQNRFNYIVSQFGEEYFKDKTLLELGGGFGDLGAMFVKLGAKVTSVDARPYYAKEGARRYPDIDFVTQNLEEDFSNLGTYDIVLHTGLLYHIPNIEKHLKHLSSVIGNLLILETECCDSSDPFVAVYHHDRYGYDQSFSGKACAPSPAFVERLLAENSIHFTRHDHSSLNTYCVDTQNGIIIYHRYNWVVSETKHKGPTHRRLWMCYKEAPTVVKRKPNFKPMSNKIKTAICISGHFRSFSKSVHAIQQHILNNPYIDYDIFIHTWDAIDRGLRPGIKRRKILAGLNPKDIVIEPHMEFIITPLMNEKNFNLRDINGLLSMFYKIQECNNLKIKYEKENGFTYDCVIRLRADLQLCEDLRISSSLDLNKLHIPAHGDYGGINDQFAFSNSKNMDTYSSIFSNIERYLEQGILLNPEYFVKQMIEENQFQLERPDIDYLILWSNGTSWNNKNRHSL